MTVETKAAIRERLERITARNGGRLTPEAVVADAKKPSSPLHSQFEWDTAKAAYSYWLEQARTLIGSVRIEIRTDTTLVQTVAYVRDPSADNDEQGYVSVESLRRSPASARAALRYELGRADALLDRCRSFAIALSLEAEMDHILGEIRSLSGMIEEAAV